MEERTDESIRKATPGYMKPNFASILPDYANIEADQIRNAFSQGNYQSLNKIPNKITPSSIIRSKHEQMDSNRQEKRVPKLVTSCGLFSQFEYIPSRYSLGDDLEKMERLESQAKRLHVGGKEFQYSGESRRLKHQDNFEAQDKTFPYVSEPYDHAHDAELRAKWISDQKVLHGPFVGASNRGSLQEPATKALLPEILKAIRAEITRDWEDYNFSVSVTKAGNIAIAFDYSAVDIGLVAYMNLFARNHKIVNKYHLVKVADDWNNQPGDGGLYFVLRPPWVKNNADRNSIFSLQEASKTKS